MPYNGSGSYSPPAASFPAVANTLIESAKFNAVINDIATALSTAITKDGQTTITANLPMGGFRHTGVGAVTAQGQYGRVNEIQAGTYNLIGSAAGTDTITGSLAPTITAYTKGMGVCLVAAGTNTGAATLNLNGVGAKTISKNSPGGYTSVVANDIISGNMYFLIYDDAGSDQWVLLNPGIPSIGGYLPLSGGTLTGALTGTSGSFPTGLTVGTTSGVLQHPDGTVAAPGLRVGTSGSTGVYSSGDNSWNVTNAGTVSLQIYSTRGMSLDSPTGGDKGAGTINAKGYYLSGTVLPVQQEFQSTAQTITSGGTLTLAHGLARPPRKIQLSLVNVNTEGGWVTGDEVFIPSGVQPGTNVGVQAFILNGDTTNIKVVFGTAANAIAYLSNAGGAGVITNANWTLRVRAYA